MAPRDGSIMPKIKKRCLHFFVEVMQKKLWPLFFRTRCIYELKQIEERKVILKLNQVRKNYIRTVTKSKSKLKL